MGGTGTLCLISLGGGSGTRAGGSGHAPYFCQVAISVEYHKKRPLQGQ